MEDEKKTKEQLIEELKEMHLQLAALEKQEFPENKLREEEMKQQARRLTKRVKELDCIYDISNLIEKSDISIERILCGAVELLPPAMQYPYLACARIVLKDKTYETANFQESPWRMACAIRVQGESAGMAEVFYRKEPTVDGQEPFIPEEDKLLNAVAERLGRVIDRKRAEEALLRTEENFRRSLDDSPLGVRIVSKEGETIYANQAILDIYGYEGIEELKTTPVMKRYTPESVAEFQIRREKRKQGDYLPSEYEVSIVRKDGAVRHLRVFRKEILWDGESQYQVIYQDITDHKLAEKDREKLISELQNALSEVKKLSGMLPICASCKRIRDDNGYWEQIESYIRGHSEAEFSHGICPDCAKKLYPELYKIDK
ncbi:MAG: PAS domain S-box protein [Deltaproteobacteria bacterium]|nr:PAS domain S-box protein [Deltaproteobacteria bacterium]